jgi:hypothetical protein
MAYVAGDTILDDEYNEFLTNTSGTIGINHTMGTGATVYGLGQTELPTVQGGADSGTTVTAASWNALLTAMDNIGDHTNDTLTARTQVGAGDPITIKSAIAADLVSLAAEVAAGSVNATAISAGSELQSSRSSTRYVGSHIVEHTVTFSNANEMRFFFNAGGKIRVNLTRVGGGLANGTSTSDKDDSVDEMITAMGDFDIKSLTSSRSGTTETLTTDGFAIGFQDVTTSYQTVFLLTQANGTYTSMTLKGEIKGNATAGSTTNVTIKMSLTDADSGDILYTSGNLNSIDVNENFLGQTDFATKLMLPTTAQGLDPVYTLSGSAETSNTTA